MSDNDNPTNLSSASSSGAVSPARFESLSLGNEDKDKEDLRQRSKSSNAMKKDGTLRMIKRLSLNTGTVFSRGNTNFLSSIPDASRNLVGEVPPPPERLSITAVYGPRKLPSGNILSDPIDAMQRFRRQVREHNGSLGMPSSDILALKSPLSARPSSIVDSSDTPPPAVELRQTVYQAKSINLEELDSAIFAGSPKTIACLSQIKLTDLLDVLFDHTFQPTELDFVELFVLNYGFFMKTTALVEETFARFSVVAPPDATNKQKLEFKHQVDSIRRRVVHIQSRLIARCWKDLVRENLVASLERFAESLTTEYKQVYLGEAYKLQETIRNQKLTDVSTTIRMQMRERGLANQRESPLIAERSGPIAVEITLIEQGEFRQIKPPVWLPLLQPNGVPIADDLNKVIMTPISWFVRMSRWVATEIVDCDNQMRAYIIRKFIKIAASCRELNNFNSVAWIVHGLTHPAVSRLASAWQGIPKKYTELFEDLQKFVAPKANFALYRAVVDNIKPPFIPIAAIELQDLSKIESMEATDETLDGELIVRFDRCRAVYAALLRFEERQLVGYKMESNEVLRTFLSTGTALDDDLLLEKSNQVFSK